MHTNRLGENRLEILAHGLRRPDSPAGWDEVHLHDGLVSPVRRSFAQIEARIPRCRSLPKYRVMLTSEKRFSQRTGWSPSEFLFSNREQRSSAADSLRDLSSHWIHGVLP
jgi:hypothetical protein